MKPPKKIGPSEREIIDEAQTIFDQDDAPEAIRMLEELLQRPPIDTDIWELQARLGEYYSYDRQYEKALAFLSAAIETVLLEDAPDWCFGIMLDLGQTLLRLERFEDSLVWFKRGEKFLTSKSKPEYTIDRYLFHLGKARALLYCEQAGEAILEFRKARQEVEESPRDDPRYLPLLDVEIARATLYNGEPAEALRLLRLIDTTHLPEDFWDPYYFTEGKANWKLGGYEEALTAFERLERIGVEDDDKSELYCMMSDVYFQLGDLEQAEKYLKSSLERPAIVS